MLFASYMFHKRRRHVDQVTDILFILESRKLSLTFALFGALFVGSFVLVTVVRAVAQGRGLTGALLAATGTELAVRYA